MKTKFKLNTLLFFVLILNTSIMYLQSSKSSISATGVVAQGFGGKLSFNYYNNESSFIQALIEIS